jgi:DNA-binding transcriptional LysR family regulator
VTHGFQQQNEGAYSMASGGRDNDYGLQGMSLESLRMFLIAYEECNLTRAAERSNIALSAFTKRIQNLEYQLQAPLFERHARGISATPAGDEFAYHVRDILKRLNMARQVIAEFSTGIRGRIRISATPSAIVGGLADDIVHFSQENARTEVELKESDSWSVIPDLESGRSDLGFNMSAMEIPPGMTAKVYRPADLVAIVAANHPLAKATHLTFAELLDYEHISLGERSTLRTFFVKQAEDARRQFRFRPVSSFDVMRSMVAAGLGVGIMPEMMTKSPHEKPQVVAIPISESWAQRSIKIWYREDTLVPASRLFRDHLLNRGPS